MSSGVSRESLCLKNFLNVQANPLAWCATSQVSPSYRSRKPQAPASQRCTYGVWAPAGMRIRRSSTSSDLQAANGTFTDKWPIGLIKSLARAVSTDPREIETILFDIEKYGQLRKDRAILPQELGSLAESILALQDPKYYSTVQGIWRAASRLGDSLATLRLMIQAYRKNEIHADYLADERKRIQALAERGNPAALFFYGVVSQDMNGDLKSALRLYLRSTTTTWENWPDAQKIDLYGGDIWSRISAAKAKLGDRAGAQEALKISAEDYDDPVAYFHLAKSFMGPYGNKYEFYMLKAAASGNTSAAHLLGVYYYEQARGNVLSYVSKEGDRKPPPGYKPTSSAISTARELAQQWFAVGAEAGIVSSMIHNAVLVRGRYFAKYGQGWLDRAKVADVKREWKRTIERLAQQKTHPHLDFRDHSIEELHRKLDGVGPSSGKK